MLDALRSWLRRHPRWVSAVFLFCVYMTFVYMPYDVLGKLLTQDVAQAEEVWFGVVLRGFWAKLTEPLHWLIYGGLAYGMWRERPWVWPAAGLYTAQIAVGMLVWNLRDERGLGPLGLLAFALFGALSVALWRYRPAPSH